MKGIVGGGTGLRSPAPAPDSFPPSSFTAPLAPSQTLTLSQKSYSRFTVKGIRTKSAKQGLSA